jgi:hypothetical protein
MADVRPNKARQKTDVRVNWRLLPRGSPEREAAIAAERRERAAAARAKKAQKARAEAEAGAGTGGEVGEEQLSIREIIKWVWEHLGEAKCPRAPNRQARELWRFAKENRDEFLKQYVPLLLRGEAAVGDFRTRVRQMLEEFKNRNSGPVKSQDEHSPPKSSLGVGADPAA